MATDLAQFHQAFFEEAAEHLDSMEQLLLQLDPAAPAADDLNAIFRAAHSIKGGAGTFGFTDMAGLTHILETLLDKLRNHELALRGEMIDVFLQAGDLLRGQLDGHRAGRPVGLEPAAEVMAQLKQLGEAPQAPATDAWTVLYTPARADDAIANNLRRELEALAAAVEFAAEERPDGSRQYRYQLRTAAGEAALRELFDFVALPGEVSFAGTGEDPGYGLFEATPGAPAEEAGFGLFEDAPGAPAETAFGLFEDAPGAPAETAYGFFEPLPAAPPPPAEPRPAAAARPAARAQDKAAADTSIRVGVDKVDQMINLVGELVITQAMLAQSAAQFDPVQHERLLAGMAQLERNTRDLQQAVMSVRMLPMSAVFSRFPRVVRDLAGKLGKEIELVTEGESTELDKGLIEKIVDPLTHLVRNSLDHGIESPERREAAGKPRRGTLLLRAAHQGGSIVIEVEDDGAGLDRDRLLAKAREKGLAVNDTMSDQEVWQIIFMPGFSTAETITDVSGRGVGMDVVKRNIDALGGRVEIFSNPGRGARVAIRLPLTLAILDGMSVAVGDETFIVPLTCIAESLQPAAGDIRSVSGRGRLVHVRGEYLPLLPLHQVFNHPPRSSDPTQGILVIVESGTSRVALQVDALVGQQQVVIKSLEANYRRVEGIAGATIMGDGRVALILDIASLVRMSQNQTGAIA